MAFSGDFFCTVFKVDLFKGIHEILQSGGDSFKMSLYTNSATLNAATTMKMSRSFSVT